MAAVPEETSDSQPPDALFVYGTLRSQCQNRFAQLLGEGAKLLGPARAHGRLYRISSYPALVHSDAPDAWVTGELYRLDPASALLTVLDDYEGCGAHHSPPFEFERIIGEAVLRTGQTIRCWIYMYGKGQLSEESRIVSGDFLSSARLENG